MSNLIDRICDTATRFRRKADAIAAPELGHAVRHPYGAFRFKAKIGADVAFEIQASTNLKSWQTIVRDTVKEEEIEYVDSEASKFSFRCYRIQAGGTFSTSVIGYVTTSLPPGLSMIANPFNAPSNEISQLLKDMPEGTKLNKFDAQMYQLKENCIKNGKWMDLYQKLNPGEGAMLFNPGSDYLQLSFVGNVLQGQLSLPVPAGFSMLSSQVPLPGRLDKDLGFPITEGDSIHLFDRDRQQYMVHPYDPEKWDLDPPLINVAESFWVATATPKNWSRTVSLLS